MSQAEPDLVAAILSGDVSEQEPEVRAALEARPELRAELEELRRLQGSLDRDGEFVREASIGGDKRGLTDDGGPRNSKGHLRRLSMWLALAAAAILLFRFTPWGSDSEEPSPGQGQVLGPDDFEMRNLHPVGPGVSFEQFRFEAPIPSGARIEFLVWSGSSEVSAEPLHVHRETQYSATESGMSWKPSADTLEMFGATIRWRVRITDMDGRPLGVSEVLEASR